MHHSHRTLYIYSLNIWGRGYFATLSVPVAVVKEAMYLADGPSAPFHSTAGSPALFRGLPGWRLSWASFLPLARSKVRLCSTNHRAGYFSNLACDWQSIVWAYSKQETENGPTCTLGPLCLELDAGMIVFQGNWWCLFFIYPYTANIKNLRFTFIHNLHILSMRDVLMCVYEVAYLQHGEDLTVFCFLHPDVMVLESTSFFVKCVWLNNTYKISLSTSFYIKRRLYIDGFIP